MKKQLKKFVALCNTNEEYQRKLDMLIRVSKSEEWRFVISLLWSIKSDMAAELLESSKYTKEDHESKDVTQKVYHNIAEMIDFFAQPRNWIAKKNRLQLSIQKIKGEKPERMKQNG